MHMYLCMYVFMYMHVFIYLQIYMYIYVYKSYEVFFKPVLYQTIGFIQGYNIFVLCAIRI
jgi:hypothetical protein